MQTMTPRNIDHTDHAVGEIMMIGAGNGDHGAGYLPRKDASKDRRAINELTNSGVLYHQRGEYDQAIRYFRKALKLQRSQRGGDHPTVAHTLSNIGSVLFHKGDSDEAMSYLKESLRISKGCCQVNLVVSDTLTNIANIHSVYGAYDDAYVALVECLEVQEELVGDSHPCIADTLFNLGVVQTKRGDTDSSIKHFQDALVVARTVMGDSTNVVHILEQISTLQIQRGNYGEGLQYMREALQILIDLLGNEHVNVASCWYNVGLIHLQLNQAFETNHSFVTALGIYKKNGYDDYHPSVQALRQSIDHLDQSGKNNPLEIGLRDGSGRGSCGSIGLKIGTGREKSSI